MEGCPSKDDRFVLNRPKLNLHSVFFLSRFSPVHFLSDPIFRGAETSRGLDQSPNYLIQRREHGAAAGFVGRRDGRAGRERVQALGHTMAIQWQHNCTSLVQNKRPVKSRPFDPNRPARRHSPSVRV